MFAHASCLPCLIFIWVSSTPIDNQLLTKTFCSPPGDRLSGAPRAASSRNLPELLSPTTIVIAGRLGQERISFRMLLTSEPLSCTMPSSSVCHENPLHVIMGVCMSTSTTAIPGPYTSRGKSMTRHIAYNFQRRQCPCASSLACSGQRRLCSCADFGLSPEKVRKTGKRACRHKQHALNSIEMKVHKLFFQVVVFHKAVIVHAVVVARNVILDILPVPR